jgi:hypothetical protein
MGEARHGAWVLGTFLALVGAGAGCGSSPASLDDAGSSEEAGQPRDASSGSARDAARPRDASAEQTPDARSSCPACLTGTGIYDGTPVTFDCDYDSPNSKFTTAENPYAASYDTWLIACVATDDTRMVYLWFDAGQSAGEEDFKGTLPAGISLYEPTSLSRYLNANAPNLVTNRITWQKPGAGQIAGSFDAEWTHRSDGNPYGRVSGTFSIRLSP